MIRIVMSIDNLIKLKARIKDGPFSSDEVTLVEELLERRIKIELRRQQKLREKIADQRKAGESDPPDSTTSDQNHNTDKSIDLDAESEDMDDASSESPETKQSTDPTTNTDPKKDKKPKGHGRNPHTVFKNAGNIHHSLPPSIMGAHCQKCGGDFIKQAPKIQIVVRGQPNFEADRHISESVVCRCCRHSVVAPTPEVKGGIGKAVIYAPSAVAMLLVLHYGAFLPFNRIAQLHKSWDVPFASSNQWDVVVEAFDRLKPLFKALIAYAALHLVCIRFDDTGAIIWSIKRAIRDGVKFFDKDNNERTGINSSCFLMVIPEGTVTLFDTGLHHAAEIFKKLLEGRDPEAENVIKVTDHANKNYIADNGETINGSCHTHIYLKFLLAKKAWPAEYAVVGDAYHTIYQNELYAKNNNLSATERLDYHQKNSTEPLNKIHELCKELLESKKIDRSDIIWPAVSIVVNQWPLMQKFLEVAGVPLDTNDVEQTLIQIVKLMAATLGYKNKNGAEKGDLVMTLIATAKNFGLEPCQYIQDCLENYKDLQVNPDHYLPWNYHKRLQLRHANTGQDKAA